MSAERRLAELKLELPPAAKPMGVYKPVVIVGNLAFTSGHGPLKPDKTLITGRVGADLDVVAGKAAARQTGLAILASLRDSLGSLDRVTRIVKTLGLVNCTPEFSGQPAVINGFSELMAEVFGPEAGVGSAVPSAPRRCRRIWPWRSRRFSRSRSKCAVTAMEPKKPQSCRFAAALATADDTDAAIANVCGTALKQLGAPPNLAVLFASAHHASRLDEAAAQACEAIGSEMLMGCTGESIIGGSQEIEQAPAISLWLAALPATTVIPMHLDFQQTHEGGTFVGWAADLPDVWPDGAAMLLMGEPFSFPADELVRRLNEDHAGAAVLGGMASGGVSPGENRLILGRRVYDTGAVAVLIHGAVRIRSVVSQGCRPIGQPFVVTRAEANVIHELGGAPPLVRLQEVFDSLSAQEQRLVRSGVHVGRVLSEYRDKFDRGDFLVRNVIGADPNTGAIAIGDFVRPARPYNFTCATSNRPTRTCERC